MREDTALGSSMPKRNRKRRLIVVLIALAAVIVLGVVLSYPIRSFVAINTMRPLESYQVTKDVYAINNKFVNLYLFKTGGDGNATNEAGSGSGDETYILFDAGADSDATASELDRLGIKPGDVAAVFLTHTDYDHVDALSLFPAAGVYMAKSNLDFLDTLAGRSRSKAFLGQAVRYSDLGDGEVVTIQGTRIQCVFTPGHTDGSASYVVDGRYLFSGDTLNLENGKAVTFNAVFNMNDKEQEQSIRKLARLEGIETLFTMHTGYTDDFETAFSEWSDQ